MEAQPEAEATICVPTYVLDSEDSEEESNQEEFPVTSWSELSIIERVGLNSAEMSEGDLETAFSQIALAFRCDQYTLKQRLQAEEHARNLAEENIHLELSRGRETLETLKALCLDSKRSNILQKLELSLDIVAGTVERISNTAEVLGAVHQEARVSRAVELMVAHVENLRRRHERTTAELEDAKTLIDPRGSPDLEDGDNRRRAYLNSSRRRVSVSLIPARTQKKLKQHLRKRAAQRESSPCPSPPPSSESSTCATTKEDSSPVDNRPLDPDETPAEDSAAQAPPQPSPDSKQECLPARPLATRKIQTKPHPLDTLRQRHKGKAALSKKKSEKDKKSLNYYRRLSASRSGSLWTRPSAQWLNHRRWSLLCTYLFVLCCVILLTYLLFELL